MDLVDWVWMDFVGFDSVWLGLFRFWFDLIQFAWLGFGRIDFGWVIEFNCLSLIEFGWVLLGLVGFAWVWLNWVEDMAHGVIEAKGITDEEEHAVTIFNMLRNLGLVGLDCVC